MFAAKIAKDTGKKEWRQQIPIASLLQKKQRKEEKRHV